jgi:hypothetical protein
MVRRVVDYMPQRFHHRHHIWLGTVAMTCLALAVIAAFHFSRIYVSRLAVFFVLACIGVALIRAALIARRGNWECRIEAGVVSWQIPRSGWSDVRLTELAEVVTMDYPNTKRGCQYELVTRNGDRLILDRRHVGPSFVRFKSAILVENRVVVFGSRNGNLCRQCGTDLRVRQGCCPNCGTVIPDQRKIVRH